MLNHHCQCYCRKLAFHALCMLAWVAVIAALVWVAVIAALAWWVGLEELAREHFSASLTVALCSSVHGGKEFQNS